MIWSPPPPSSSGNIPSARSPPLPSPLCGFSSSSGISIGVVVGIKIAGVLILVVLSILCVCCTKKKRSRQDEERDFVDELKIRWENLVFFNLSCLVFHIDVSFYYWRAQMIWFVQSSYRNYPLIFTSSTATGSGPHCNSMWIQYSLSLFMVCMKFLFYFIV